jgi:hypothetical protein
LSFRQPTLNFKESLSVKCIKSSWPRWMIVLTILADSISSRATLLWHIYIASSWLRVLRFHPPINLAVTI